MVVMERIKARVRQIRQFKIQDQPPGNRPFWLDLLHALRRDER